MFKNIQINQPFFWVTETGIGGVWDLYPGMVVTGDALWVKDTGLYCWVPPSPEIRKKLTKHLVTWNRNVDSHFSAGPLYTVLLSKAIVLRLPYLPLKHSERHAWVTGVNLSLLWVICHSVSTF